MTEERLREIEARALVACPGPWGAESYRGGDYVAGAIGLIADVYSGSNGGVDESTIDRLSRSNAAFIAHARQDVPELVAEVRRLREALMAIGLRWCGDCARGGLPCNHDIARDALAK